jgi:large subunit ribosomal protein L10
MENPRPEKVAVVDEVRERLSSASATILTEYRGLTVKDIATLRRALRDAGGEYKIYKNTLVRFAVQELGLTDLEGLLTGPTAIAFVENDAAAVAKALRDFGRTNPHLVVKGGLLGGNVLTPADATALAELPSRDVLLARIAGGLAAPMQKFAGLLQALPRNMAYGLKALIDQKVAAGEAAPEPEPEPEPAAEAKPEPEPVAESQPTDEAAPAEPVAESEVAEEGAPEAPTDEAVPTEGAEDGN